MSILQGARRILFAHAHPDDETIATGALIAQLSGSGVECGVLTATRGERGEIVPGSYSGSDLDAHREGELAAALALLGVRWHAFLGTPPARAHGLAPRRYRDSGMRWVREGLAGPADEHDPGSFTGAREEELLADLRAGFDAFAPDLVITYDDAGGYGHPDHVRMHHACLGAAGPGLAVAEIIADDRSRGEWLDCSEQYETVAAALRQHATQLRLDGRELTHVGGQREPVRLSLGLRRIR